ncbi:TorD/DmsD family molecular chaperone [Desulfitobacterium hafniense]|uniref:TorD/DmsD family molecular chaperone n=1 Tax=Desulfitobacterium hafniense TaxID=49338 RepID=UPI00035CA061|nr:molecular chaperone TorD family protein [Desulfitobacterium hafniense]
MNNSIPDAHSEADAKLMQVALNRSDVYQLLAISFRDPTPELIDGLLSGTYRSDTADCVHWLNADSKRFDEPLAGLERMAIENANRRSDEVLREMKVEYARLFIGPGAVAVSPYETTYFANSDEQGDTLLFNSLSARSVEKAYKEAGVSLASDQNEPPDHIATELEFLMYLCAQEGQAWKNEDNELAKKWRRSERDFIDKHLGNWAFSFFNRVAESTTFEAYRVLALLGKTFLELERGA